MADNPYAALVQPDTPYSTRVVFVAGGSGGIGAAVARAYAAKAWSVFLVARNKAKLDAAAADVRAGVNANGAKGARVETFAADLRNVAEARAAAEACRKAFGAITVVVCCAGEFPRARALSVDDGTSAPEAGLLSIELNVVRTTTPYLRRAREGGVALLNSSLYRLLLDYPGLGHMMAWSNGVAGLAESLMTELRQAHVRVSLVSLGLTRTAWGRATKAVMGGAVNGALADEAKWVQPADVARTVSFVMDPASANGQICDVVLNPQVMLERNHMFTDAKRVDKMVAELTTPAFRDGRVALVTGAGKGIGRGIAIELARAGFHVAALTRTQADLDTLKEECRAVNPATEFLGISVDVTDRPAVAAAVKRVVEVFGTLTVVVSNAGTNRRRVAALADIETWSQVMEVDLIAAMNLTRLTLPYLLRHVKLSRGAESAGVKPTLAFVSSNYAHPKGVRMAGLSPYLAAKHGTNAFAGTVLQEVRDMGVQVCIVNPSVVATPLGTKPNAAAKDGELIAQNMLLRPADCGRTVVLMATMSPSCILQDVSLETTYHPYPVVRGAHAKWLSSLM